MALPRAKTVEELYAECRDHDLVLVRGPPLADALNRRLERAHFGPFATTPRRLAVGHRETAEDRIAFLHVGEQTDLDWKEAAFVVGNVLQCWEHRGTAEAILQYDGFDTPATREVLDVLAELDTTSSELDEDQIEPEHDVAVVGLEEFTPLERSILPERYDEIDPFVDLEFDRPPFRLFDSPAAIVDTVLSSVTEENADRVAIVLDPQSPYSALVEAGLEAADIPFYGGPGFDDDPDHRAFLRLLDAAHAGSDLRLREVRPVLERLGGAVDIEHDEKRLAAVDLPAVSWLMDFREGVRDLSFAEALDAFEAEADIGLAAFRDELAALGLLEERVTEAAVGRLGFYLDSYEVPVERANEGVLLADAKAATTVDRPAVFYLGMGEGWTHDAPRRPWVDRDAEYARNLRQFIRLLQNGQHQYYLVQDAAGGRPVTPCLYFEELLDEEFERFSDLESERHAPTFRQRRAGFDREPLELETEAVGTLSQSTLNRLVNCPRDHLFGRVVEDPDRDYFTKGQLFHDFAEVCAHQPDVVDETVIDDVVELMLEATRPFDRAVDRETNRTEYRVGLETIAAFLDEHRPVGAPFLTPFERWGENAVAAHLGVEIDGLHTEYAFEDPDLGLRGLIDLVLTPTHLLDYKSGTLRQAKQVVGRAALEPPHDEPDFQALLYLTWLRARNPDEPLSFTFFHVTEHLDDVVAGEGRLEDCLTTVRYHPVTFEAYIRSERVLKKLREEASGDCQKTFASVPHGDYAEVLEGHEFPEGDRKDELLDSELGEALVARASAIVGDYAYVENGCGQALRHLMAIRDSAFFDDDLDAFEAFVTDRLAELNRYRAGDERFPVEGLGGEPNWRRVDHRDMLFEGDA